MNSGMEQCLLMSLNLPERKNESKLKIKLLLRGNRRISLCRDLELELERDVRI